MSESCSFWWEETEDQYLPSDIKQEAISHRFAVLERNIEMIRIIKCPEEFPCKTHLFYQCKTAYCFLPDRIFKRGLQNVNAVFICDCEKTKAGFNFCVKRRRSQSKEMAAFLEKRVAGIFRTYYQMWRELSGSDVYVNMECILSLLGKAEDWGQIYFLQAPQRAERTSVLRRC